MTVLSIGSDNGNNNEIDKNTMMNYSIESEEVIEADGKNFENKTRKRHTWTDLKTFFSMTEAHNYLVEKGFGKRDKSM